MFTLKASEYKETRGDVYVNISDSCSEQRAFGMRWEICYIMY